MQGLRVGNWVVTNFGTYELVGIDNDNDKCVLKMHYRDVIYSICNCDPVATNAELLLENGFLMKNEKPILFTKQVRDKFGKDALINVDADYRLFVNNSSEKNDVKNFHDLQNIYLAITGVEFLNKN